MSDLHTVSEPSVSTKYDAQLLVSVHSSTGRKTIAPIVITLCSTSWLVLLIATGQVVSTIPWCLTLLFISALTLPHMQIFRNLKIRSGISRATLDLPRFDFPEACAFSYILLSLSMGTWLIFHRFYKSEPLLVKRQVVDIQLTSLSDFSDQHELLPNSKNLPVLRQQSSTAKVTQQGALSVNSPSTDQALTIGTQRTRIATAGKTATTHLMHQEAISTPLLTEQKFIITQPRTIQLSRTDSKPIQVNSIPTTAETRFVISQAPSDLVSHSELNRTYRQRSRSAGEMHYSKTFQRKHDEIFLEEVAPPDMVELLDNQGDTSLEVWQPGGRSSGGTGSRSLLSEYLKDLHRRLKRAWSPQAGENRSAEILFRIRHDGRLSSLKVTRSSGDSKADEAIMHAITSSSPFKSLPPDYAPEYIDLQYTFNYKVDQLTEITESRVH